MLLAACISFFVFPDSCSTAIATAVVPVIIILLVAMIVISLVEALLLYRMKYKRELHIQTGELRSCLEWFMLLN